MIWAGIVISVLLLAAVFFDCFIWEVGIGVYPLHIFKFLEPVHKLQRLNSGLLIKRYQVLSGS